ncbi:methionyl-tRNA formyltransferase [Mechercharimyces sp. CAU 1602]|uniref:methionyl-tRNA formyltransferase n=1 Tax=Mechercharimyces sp. CAU 1602 TaxID=2973933 RepID=UPI002163273A|nr:methionyl-tRNA formyltransferase [Mechercharimyces sp. CAU 1602]MCS1351396.1 methionyl-tRNA formyltransferase [Mechercharimyces sp. CAU 1602]
MGTQPRIIFMGTPDFAVPSFRALIDHGYHVVAVVTQPDRPKGRKRILTPPPVKEAALAAGIPVLQPEKLREEEAVTTVLEYAPDLVVTAAYGQLLPQALLKAPTYGCINVHASLLPKYRGGAPIHHALIQGEEMTGITIMYMVKALDAGDMLAQATLPIAADDHVGTLHDRLSKVGAELLVETLPPLLTDKLTPRPQAEELVTYAPNIRREDEQVDWKQPVRAIYNQVRGLHPWPVAFTHWRGKPLKLWWAEVADESSDDVAPGTITKVAHEGIWIACGKGHLRLTEVQPAGKKRMDVASFVRGHEVQVGEKLGDE